MCPTQTAPTPVTSVKNQREFAVQPGSASGLTSVTVAPLRHHLIPSGPSNGSQGRGIMQSVRKGTNAAIAMSTETEQMLRLIVSARQPRRSSAGKADDPKEIIL